MSTATQCQHLTTIDWKKCCLCQKVLAKARENLRKSKQGYETIERNLPEYEKFEDDCGPSSLLDDGDGISNTLENHEAVYHKSCALKITDSALEKKRRSKGGSVGRPKRKAPEAPEDGQMEACLQAPSPKKLRSGSQPHHPAQEICCICDGREKGALHTLGAPIKLKYDKKADRENVLKQTEHMREMATVLQTTPKYKNILVTKVIGTSKNPLSDVRAAGLFTHNKCHIDFKRDYEKEIEKRKSCEPAASSTQQSNSYLEYIGMQKIANFIHNSTRTRSGNISFKLNSLEQMYLEFLLSNGIDRGSHTTRFHEDLKKIVKNLQSVTTGGNKIYVSLPRYIKETALKKKTTSEQLSKIQEVAQILRKSLRSVSCRYKGSLKEEYESCVFPNEVKVFLGSLLENSADKFSCVSNSMAQLLLYNLVSDRAAKRSESHYHSTSNEPPLPLYFGLKIYSKTRSAEIINNLNAFGICPNSRRLSEISNKIANSMIERFEEDKTVVSSCHRKNVFTTAGYDNWDHDPKSTGAKVAYHGAAISITQHPDGKTDGIKRCVNLYSPTASLTSVGSLPLFYTEMLQIDWENVPFQSSVTSDLESLKYKECDVAAENDWLKSVDQNLCDSDVVNVSWAAYHAPQLRSDKRKPCITSILPLFTENSKSCPMVKHGVDVIRKAVQFLNPSQTPVITMDEPLFCIAKQLQWHLPAEYGERELVLLLGGLHEEKACWPLLGVLLKNSGWVKMLCGSGTFTPGRADSFVNCVHIKRTEYGHQVTAAVLFSLKSKAYEDNGTSESHEQWVSRREEESMQFKYWNMVLRLEMMILCLVRSFREHNFSKYIECLKALAPWFFALNRTHYKRWLPVHLKDMADLKTMHPDVFEEFMTNGSFTGQKSLKRFSCIPLDQIHEQENIKVKGVVGVTRILQEESALRRWMIAGPECAKDIEDFEDLFDFGYEDLNEYHHEESLSLQIKFKSDVQKLLNYWEEKGNPFKEDHPNLLNVFTREVAPEEVGQCLFTLEKIGAEQYAEFVKTVLIDKSKPFWSPIKNNKLYLFGYQSKSATGKVSSSVTLLKKNNQIFLNLMINSQARQGNTGNFFSCEPFPYPPALSVNGNLRFGTKSDILKPLLEKQTSSTQIQPVGMQAILLDGPAIVQSMKIPETVLTFNNLKEHFWKHIVHRSANIATIHVVFDVYLANSLKQSARNKRGVSNEISFQSSTVLPKKFNEFLRNSSNKTKLFTYLSEKDDCLRFEDKDIIVTKLNEITVCKATSSESDSTSLELLSPSDHEEADTRLILHCLHCSQQGLKNILVHTVDSDVVVIAVHFFESLHLDSLWIRFGVGKNVKYIACHEIASSLTSVICKGLTFFHAWTGVDTVSSFERHGKKTAWSTWLATPEAGCVFEKLSKPNSILTPEDLKILEAFVIKWYCKSMTADSLDDARKRMVFERGTQPHQLPPTSAAVKHHTLRGQYQAGEVWGRSLQRMQNLPDPCEYGWKRNEDRSYSPVWTTLQPATKNKINKNCSCKNVSCTRNCGCKTDSMSCTSLCLCRAMCGNK